MHVFLDMHRGLHSMFNTILVTQQQWFNVDVN
uniref:Uncharacterized protein n=1 Tax=Nelumbo nucifera TaxID=4432 RepID=A0A822YBX5_NELNU|nr:TPA_asm: hypothetical protein HUJ06_031270 [Nelumbo nucifera]